MTTLKPAIAKAIAFCLRLGWTVVCMSMVCNGLANAALLSDDFTGAIDTNNWTLQQFNGYPCLTAGTTANSTGSVIPPCNYSTPDAIGSGAMRLTPAQGNQHSAIVTTNTYPSNQGLQVTFTAYSWGGSRDGPASIGADGISFFLQDGSVPTYLTLPDGTSVPNLGSFGGSLAYSCSNTNSPYTGITGGYLGLGIDEYGNFLNGGSGNDNTSTGIPVQTSSTSTNGYNSFTVGSYQQANRIGLRGAGNVSWYWLNRNYPLLYPSTLSTSAIQAAVQNTCKSGFLWNYGSAVSQNITSASVSGSTMTVTIPSTTGYTNGDSVTIGGTITAAASSTPRSISSPSVNGSTLTFTASGGSYSVGQAVAIAGTITVMPAAQTVSSITWSNSAGQPRIFVPDTSMFTVGQYAYISGISGGTGYTNNRAYQVTATGTSNGNGFIRIDCSVTSCTSNVPTISGSTTATPVATQSAPSAVSIAGNYTTITGTTGSTVKVTLGLAAASVTNTSGTVSTTAPTVPGSYTISNLTGTTFDVTLSSPATSITNTSGNVTNTSIPTNGRQTAISVLNYGVIPGGYWVLPSSQLLATNGATSRANATPITYKLQITPSGNLSFWYSYNGGAYQTVLSNWNMTTSNGPLPSTFRFGFAGSTGGSNNNHDLSCFLAEPVQSNSGAGANTVQAGQVRTGTQVYTASYDPNFWTGSVMSQPISSTASGLVISTPTWDASCVLSGGTCSATGVAIASAQGSSDRTLITWDGTRGVPFQYSNLNSAQKTALDSTDSQGSNRVDWLRGGRNNEQSASPPGQFRARASVLGDVVNSSPTWIGPPTMPYSDTFTDKLYSTNGSEGSYSTFVTNLAQRLNVVYVGSNDGMLHGFEAGANDSSGNYNSNLNDGKEVIGVLPYSALTSSNIVSLTNPTYGHNYFVDASPGFGDLYYGGSWHTWLVSGLGPGGKEVFALDITDPQGSATGTTSFAESNAASLVKANITPAALTSATCVNAASNCGNNLGNTYGTPLVRRLHNGQWAVIFGNGYGSVNQRAGVYIALVNTSTGALSYYWLDTGSGSSSNPNGIAYVSSADFDGDHVADYLYAGDLLGQVWRFDITSSNPADWGVSKFGQASAAPLFTTPSSQPITTQVVPTITISAGAKRVILGLGTGQGVPFTSSSPESYASGTQSIYGIWDWDMSGWNNGLTTANSVTIPASPLKLAYLAKITTSPYRTFTASNLQSNTIASTAASGTSATTRLNTVCWIGSTACPSTNNTTTTNTQYGWKFDLPYSGEQLVYNPVFQGGVLLVNTTVPPATTSVSQCTPALATGWTRGFDMASGGGLKQNLFPDSTGSLVVANGSYSITAVKLNAVGKPYIVSVGSKLYGVSQTIGGRPTITQINPQGGVTVKRVSWQQLR